MGSNSLLLHFLSLYIGAAMLLGSLPSCHVLSNLSESNANCCGIIGGSGGFVNDLPDLWWLETSDWMELWIRDVSGHSYVFLPTESIPGVKGGGL